MEVYNELYMGWSLLITGFGAHFEDSEKTTISEKEEQRTRQLVQTCVVFRASIGGKKKKENQTKKHGDVFLGFHWWKN